LSETPAIYDAWKKLVIGCSVSGVQVHDARLAAFMGVYEIRNLLTLNADDFRRFPDIHISVPRQVIEFRDPSLKP